MEGNERVKERKREDKGRGQIKIKKGEETIKRERKREDKKLGKRK